MTEGAAASLARSLPHLDLPALAARFAADGFVHIPGVLNAGELAA